MEAEHDRTVPVFQLERALHPVEVEQRRIARPGAGKPLLHGGRLRRIAVAAQRLEKPEAGPAIVRGGLQACAEDILSSFGLAGQKQDGTKRLAHRIVPVGGLHVRKRPLDLHGGLVFG